MNRLFRVLVLVISSVTLLSAGGQKDASSSERGRINVFVSILPQKYFAESIGGENVDVSVMVPPGKSPATYEPSPRQMVSLGKADLFFTIGVSFEKAFLERVSSTLTSLRIVATDRGITKRYLEAHGHDDDHGDEHGEEKGEPDPHIWMDPLLVKEQGTVMRDALIELDPGKADAYREGYRKFAADLDSLHEELEGILAPAKGSLLFVYHPAFGYFADRYGLRQEAIETGGKEPSPALLEQVVMEAREEKVKVIFVQPEFPEKSARAVADAIDGAVVPVAPLAEDYMENLRSLAREVAQGVSR
ncbi:metal ABC transporter solute-binding protein, Zn/Mn family [Marispirochaeta aestuarii]|uniref:metal ABC transporter solute-binding protein, Zn/Mn family n=1 Tax=Marispirochaeta aestuarii TaxID=1963862 RepID=UPI0029C825E5|nr:zinc ABC transporter substrate-binding protein [Marispirochaeta aestuarii]